jgi:hypothetical protein
MLDQSLVHRHALTYIVEHGNAAVAIRRRRIEFEVHRSRRAARERAVTQRGTTGQQACSAGTAVLHAAHEQSRSGAG